MSQVEFRAWDMRSNRFVQPIVDPGFLASGRLVPAEHSNQIFSLRTGLKDKNGKEIYEGDVVRRKSSDGTIELVAVEYQPPRFNIGDFVPEYGYTVIGNIYENPELLTGEEAA